MKQKRLMSHDWHTNDVPWNQSHIRDGREANGFWAVDVARAGVYEIALRRWPIEADAPITAALAKGKAIAATHARLKIGGVDETKPIPENAHAVTFEVRLKAGQTRLETWFVDEKSGKSRGAYYAYVRVKHA